MSWQTTELGDAPLKIVDGDRGKNYPKQNELLEDGYCLFLSATNVTRDGFAFDSCQFITQEKHDALRKGIVSRGDVILTTRGTLGNVALYSDRVKFEYVRINSGMVTIKPETEHLQSDFIYYFLRSDLFQSQVRSLQSGAAQPQLPIRDIKKIKFSFPDLPTQERIAGVLSAYDDLIENNRRRIALLEQAARLLYREWFVHFRFPGHETTKFVDGLPEGWDKTTVDQFLVLQRGFDLPVSKRKEGKVPIYGSTGIVGYHNEPKVKAPVITTGRSGSLGQVSYSVDDCWPLNTSLWVKQLKGIPPIFAYFFLQSLDLQKYGGGASVPTLDRKVVHRLEAYKPDTLVLKRFEDMVAPQFEMINTLNRQNQGLAKARDLLLPRLMDGRIPV